MTTHGHHLSVQVSTGFTDAVCHAWAQLEDVSDIYAFQTCHWHKTWYEELGRTQGYTPAIVCLTDMDTGQCLALFPLATVKRRGGRILTFMGGELTDYNAPLLHQDVLSQYEGKWLALWNEIIAAIDADIVALRRVPAICAVSRNPMISLPFIRVTEHAHAAKLGEDFAAFVATRSSKLFADTRRQLRRLSEIGEVRIVEVATAEEQENIFTIMQEQKSRRWRETGSRDLFALPGYASFYRRLLTQPWTGATAVMSGLSVNGQWIATHWGIRYRERFYWIMPTYAAGDWARYSPGRILLEAMIKWAIGQRLSVFDLTVGDEAYKEQWADTHMDLYAGQAALTFRGRCYLAVDALMRKIRQWGRQQDWLRRLLRKPAVPSK